MEIPSSTTRCNDKYLLIFVLVYLLHVIGTDGTGDISAHVVVVWVMVVHLIYAVSPAIANVAKSLGSICHSLCNILLIESHGTLILTVSISRLKE